MSFFEELKRRNVVRVGIAYVVIGWLLAQVAEFAFENFGAPEWVLKTFIVALLLGLPIALIFAWAFEMTPEGIKREKDVDRSQSITQHTGRKLNRLIIVVLAFAVAVLVVERFLPLGADNEPSAIADVDQSIAVLPFVDLSDTQTTSSSGEGSPKNCSTHWHASLSCELLHGHLRSRSAGRMSTCAKSAMPSVLPMYSKAVFVAARTRSA